MLHYEVDEGRSEVQRTLIGSVAHHVPMLLKITVCIRCSRWSTWIGKQLSSWSLDSPSFIAWALYSFVYPQFQLIRCQKSYFMLQNQLKISFCWHYKGLPASSKTEEGIIPLSAVDSSHHTYQCLRTHLQWVSTISTWKFSTLMQDRCADDPRWWHWQQTSESLHKEKSENAATWTFRCF